MRARDRRTGSARPPLFTSGARGDYILAGCCDPARHKRTHRHSVLNWFSPPRRGCNRILLGTRQRRGWGPGEVRWVFGGGGLVRAIWPPLAFVCPRAGGWGRSLTRILLPLGRNVRHATNRSPVIGSFTCSSPPPPGLCLRGAGERLSENSCGHFSLLVLDLDMHDPVLLLASGDPIPAHLVGNRDSCLHALPCRLKSTHPRGDG